MNDRITLKGLRAYGRHGVYEEERIHGQPFIIDAEIELDLTGASQTDDLDQTVDYGRLADRLVSVVRGDPVKLIETLAARLIDVCLEDPRVTMATITVHKPQAPLHHKFADVFVVMSRGRC